MEKQDFLVQLEKEDPFIGAERLASKFSHTIIKSEWRISYESIRSNHLNTLGWQTLAINNSKQNEEFIINLGFKKIYDFFIHIGNKQMIKLSEYGRELPYVYISKGFSNTPPPDYILSLSDYKNILISEVDVLLKKREEMKTFVFGLIDDYKSEIEEINNQSIKEAIIQKALEEAIKKGLIPNKSDKANYVNF